MAQAIRVSYKGLDGKPHEAFIQPLCGRDGVTVMHLVLGAIGGSLDVETLKAVSVGDSAGLTALIAKLLQAVSPDTFWSIASKLLRYSTIDLKECKDLDAFDGFDGHFSDIYPLVLEALKANYPDFFAVMARSGSTDGIDREAPAKS
jgi:hypothetical protein